MAEEDERYRIEQRIDHVTNESLDATKRIRQVAEETHGIGVDTLVTLNEQGEQLDNIETRLDEINVDLKQTDRNLTKLETCCCCFHCCGPRNFQSNRHYKKVYGKGAEQAMDNVVQDQPRPRQGGAHGQDQGGPIVKRVTGDEREDEMEENLQAVGDILGNLKGIAEDMGTELDRQNNQLERINKKADVNTAHLDQANSRIRRQL